MASLSAAGESMTSGSFHRVECRPYKLAKCDSCGGSVMLWRDFCATPVPTNDCTKQIAVWRVPDQVNLG